MPSQRLPGSARTLWRVRAAGWGLLALVLSMPAADADLGVPAWLPAAVIAAVGVLVVAIVPELRWRRWRYEIREDEIDLQHGTFTVKRTLIPIRRVQHVDSEVSFLQGGLGLATVTFHTAAGGTAIPAIAGSEAERVRRRVGELAKALDDV